MIRWPVCVLKLAVPALALTLAAGPARTGELTVTLTPESRAELRAIAGRLEGRAGVSRPLFQGGPEAGRMPPSDRQGGNRARVLQSGEGHEAYLSQGGTGQRAMVVQRGQGGHVALDQPADVPVLLTFQ
ncbi:MAG: hypothetical protein JJT81_10365, partial [Rubellimicrobium sp.]|nr:hypothetical protein [Rubellimicrobium sp.]